jgi:hypothetical protein
MLDDDKLEKALRDLLIDLCSVMYSRGYDVVPVGAMMRLVGVDEDRAKEHDDEWFHLDEDFEVLVQSRKKNKKVSRRIPFGVTIH